MRPTLLIEVESAAGMPTRTISRSGASPRRPCAERRAARRRVRRTPSARRGRIASAWHVSIASAPPTRPQPKRNMKSGVTAICKSERGRRPRRRHAHVALGAHQAVEHHAEEGDADAAEENTREDGGTVVDGAARAHDPEQRPDAEPGAEPERPAEEHRQHERLAAERRRLVARARTERARDRRRRARADAAAHRRDREQRHREDERHGADRVDAEPAHEVGVDDVRDRRDRHDERGRRRRAARRPRAGAMSSRCVGCERTEMAGLRQPAAARDE